MFHAVAFFVHDDKKMHMAVRKKVVQHMRKRKDFFTQFFPCPCHQDFPKDLDEEEENKWSFQAHLQDMVCSEDAWGSETELAAIAEGRRDACIVSCVWFLPPSRNRVRVCTSHDTCSCNFVCVVCACVCVGAGVVANV